MQANVEIPSYESSYYSPNQMAEFHREWWRMSDLERLEVVNKWDKFRPSKVQAVTKAKVSGVEKDAPTVTNAEGASQSKVNYRFDLMTPSAMFELGRVLHEGAEKYGDDNWLRIPTGDHLNHALIHIYAYIAGDEQDDHLSHAFTRLMMAVTTDAIED